MRLHGLFCKCCSSSRLDNDLSVLIYMMYGSLFGASIALRLQVGVLFLESFFIGNAFVLTGMLVGATIDAVLRLIGRSKTVVREAGSSSSRSFLSSFFAGRTLPAVGIVLGATNGVQATAKMFGIKDASYSMAVVLSAGLVGLGLGVLLRVIVMTIKRWEPGGSDV